MKCKWNSNFVLSATVIPSKGNCCTIMASEKQKHASFVRVPAKHDE